MTVLVILGGREVERDTFARERRGYWSAALPCVLEKYGLATTVSGPNAFTNPELLHAHPVRLIARQGIGVWSEELVERLAELSGATLIDGPLPAVVASALGVRDTGAAARDGAFQVIDAELREAGSAFGSIPGGTVGTGTTRPIQLEEANLWPNTHAPITADQAQAWHALGWDVRRLDVESEQTRVLADWFEHDGARERLPVIVERGALIGSAITLFGFLGQSHTAEPFDGAVHRNWPQSAGAEALLLGLIDLMHSRAGTSRERILPWPAGHSWSLHVRHDVDRPMTPARAGELIDSHQRLGTRATWYWRARHLSVAEHGPDAQADANRALAMVGAADAHEVALHTERIWSGSDRERSVVEAVLGGAVQGSSAHGDPTCFRYQGAPNLLWADQQGLAYTEMISHPHRLPHRCALLEQTGEIRISEVVCLPHHASFERSSVEGDITLDEVMNLAEQTVLDGGLLQILNHPDINLEPLLELLSSLPRDGRWDATASEAIDWWRAAHVDGASGPAPALVAAVQVEVRSPDGTTRVRESSLAAVDRDRDAAARG